MIESLSIIHPSAFGHSAGITAGLSTRNGGADGSPFGMNLSFSVGDNADHVTQNRTRFFGALGIGMDELAFMQQVHGSTVTRVDAPGVYPAFDGMITDQSRLFLCVTVADCVPVFILDRAVHALAVVHAGWRGTAARIVCTAIEALGVAYGALPSRMEAFIGPAAGVCCYEVETGVAGAFDPALVTVRNGRPFVDLKAANRAQLTGAGVPENTIEIHPGCTIHEKSLFHSYRRDGSLSGRMIGVAGFSSKS
jgi:polyphenol oxidase